MVLGVMEGQSRGGYFPDYILDPSVIDYTHIDKVGFQSNLDEPGISFDHSSCVTRIFKTP